jgi:Clathrin light chain
VCKMVELSHDSTKQAQDVKRMRDILILLKNTPAKATALGA